MTTPFDPAAHPALTDLGSRLPDLAGASAYQSGRDYLRKGLVKQGTIAGKTAHATVTGSTDYRVSVAFADDIKVSCTCPAHRRNKYCKHVVAVCVALLERPGDFVAGPAPEAPPKPERRTTRGERRAKPAKPKTDELRSTGLETLDRLLDELADGGLVALGPERIALLETAGDLVRALKLRRLGNLLLALQRAATAKRGQTLGAPRFARLLTDLALTRAATGAHLEERVTLDPRLGEDLLGKTWREDQLESIGGLELIELAYVISNDGEFQIETSHLADIATGTLYAEKQILPLRLAAKSGPRRRQQRLIVVEAGLYPGLPPPRIRLKQLEPATISRSDVERLLLHAVDGVPELRRRLIERLDEPFGLPDVPALFRPASLLTYDKQVGALDADGRFLALDWPASWSNAVPALLPEAERYALFGLVTIEPDGLCLRCLSVVSSELCWGRGPVFPDGVITL